MFSHALSISCRFKIARELSTDWRVSEHVVREEQEALAQTLQTHEEQEAEQLPTHEEQEAEQLPTHEEQVCHECLLVGL